MTARVLFVDPSPPDLRGGNRVTALRWALLTRRLGIEARVVRAWEGQAADALVVLHALKGADSVARWRRQRGDAPLVVALTGTDFLPDADDARRRSTLEDATRVLVLFDAARAAAPPALAARVRVLPQSFAGCTSAPPPLAGGLRVVLLANLRPVKDPLLVVHALGRLPHETRLSVTIVGGATDGALGRSLRESCADDPRLSWTGAQRRRAALTELSRAHLLLCSSRHEGGAGSIGEALAFHRGVLSTDIPAARALLGDDHPGLFPVGDADALAALLERAALHAGFVEDLLRRSRGCAPLVDRQRELHGWRALLAELGLLPADSAPPS